MEVWPPDLSSLQRVLPNLTMKEVNLGPLTTYQPPGNCGSVKKSIVNRTQSLVSNATFDLETSEALQASESQTDIVAGKKVSSPHRPFLQGGLIPHSPQTMSQFNSDKSTQEPSLPGPCEETTGNQNKVLSETVSCVELQSGKGKCHGLYLQSSDDETVLSDSEVEEAPGRLLPS